jgi:CoA-transferase family III
MPHALLEQVLRVAEPGATGKSRVSFYGADPVFPTPLRIGEAGAATIAAAALAAAALWELRTGQSQLIRVDVDAAAAGMRASRYIRSEERGEGALDLAGNRQIGAGGGLPMFQDRNGRWIYFQREFEHHREATAKVLKCEYEQESLARAISTWDAFELEDAVVAAGATAGVVRSAEEWSAHAQAKALADLPLLDIVKLSDGMPQQLPAGERPLSGIRVLDLTRVIAGPTAGRTLAEHGADVLHIGTSELPENQSQYLDGGHGKRSADVNLDSTEGVQKLTELVVGADVLVQSFRPGSLAGRGFGPEALTRLRPGLVYLSLSAFGHAGPWHMRRGFDSIVQAVSGICDELASAGRPRFAPANPLDYATGYLAAFGVMVALKRRATEGGSYHVRVSLAQTGRWLTSIGRASEASYGSLAAELSGERLSELMTTTVTPVGRLTHLTPIAQMDLTQPRWDLPTAPIGCHPAAWV